MSDSLQSLEDLTRMRLDAELAKLRQLTGETRRRQDDIARLGAALAARSAEVAGGVGASDLALQTGQDARWQAWVAREHRRLSREAAEAAARREAQSKKAQRVFGQVEALAGLREREEEESRKQAARRLYADHGTTGRGG